MLGVASTSGRLALGAFFGVRSFWNTGSQAHQLPASWADPCLGAFGGCSELFCGFEGPGKVQQALNGTS